MNALVANKVMCAEPETDRDGCCQPGTVEVVLGPGLDGEYVRLEFCERHAARRQEAASA